MTAQDWDVLIVGGGVGGAALALALSHAYPLRVLVVERHSGHGNVNRGDSLLPVVTAHLRAWGALERFEAAGARPVSKMQFYDSVRDDLLFEAPLAPPGSHPYLVLPHPRIERTLLDAACATGRTEVRYDCRAHSLIEENGRVRGLRIVQDGRAQDVTASLVVGADGSSSKLRGLLGIELPTTAYDHSFFMIDVDRPEGYEDTMRIELCAEGGILVAPQDGERVSLGVLVQPRDEKLFHAGTMEEKLAAIGRRTRLLVGRSAFPGAHLYKLKWGHAPRYAARGAALLGDAVHVTNPTLGQGMTMAIEDAASLARHVGPVLAAGDGAMGLTAALAAYERERRPSNEVLIRWSHWLSCAYAFDGWLAVTLRRQLFRFASTALGQWAQHRLWGRMATGSFTS